MTERVPAPSRVRRFATLSRRPSGPERVRARAGGVVGGVGVLALATLLALALAVELVIAGPAHAAGPTRRARSRHPTPAATGAPRARSGGRAALAHVGQVQFVTARGVYLDRGAADGLLVQQAILLARPGHARSIRCVVETVSDHAAVCRVSSARAGVGDQFRLPGGPAAGRRAGGPVPADAAPVRATPLPEDVLEGRARALADSPFEKVNFVAPRSDGLAGNVTLTGGVTFWAGPGRNVGPSGSEEMDIQLRQIRLGETDLRLDAALTAVRWQSRSGTRRFGALNATQVFVWEAEVSHRELENRTVFSVGRIWPWHMPGITLLDGVQVGRRNESGNGEIGVYGGIVPTALGILPRPDSWAGGAYGALQEMGNPRSGAPALRGEGRVGWRTAPTVGSVTEAEALAEATLRTWAVNGTARFRYASAVDRGPLWEQASIGFRLRPTSTRGGSLQLRYAGAAADFRPLLANERPSLRGGLHASANAFVTPRPWFTVTGYGSVHDDRESGFVETEVGGDLGLPQLLGWGGGLWLGASASEGWLRGRTIYAQFVNHRTGALQVLARLSGSTSEFRTPAPDLLNVTELGGYLHLEATLTQRLHLRAHALWRAPVIVQGLRNSGENSTVVSGLDVVLLL